MPIVNFVCVTVLYFSAARKLYKLTMSLRGMLLPDDVMLCYRNMAAAFVLILASTAISWFLSLFFSYTPLIIVIVTAFGGSGGLLFYLSKTRTYCMYM